MWLAEPNDNLEHFTKEWGKLIKPPQVIGLFTCWASAENHWSMKLNGRGWSFSHFSKCIAPTPCSGLQWLVSCLSQVLTFSLYLSSVSLLRWDHIMEVVISFWTDFSIHGESHRDDDFILPYIGKWEQWLFFLSLLFLWCTRNKSPLTK